MRTTRKKICQNKTLWTLFCSTVNSLWISWNKCDCFTCSVFSHWTLFFVVFPFALFMRHETFVLFKMINIIIIAFWFFTLRSNLIYMHMTYVFSQSVLNTQCHHHNDNFVFHEKIKYSLTSFPISLKRKCSRLNFFKKNSNSAQASLMLHQMINKLLICKHIFWKPKTFPKQSRVRSRD